MMIDDLIFWRHRKEECFSFSGVKILINIRILGF